MCTNVKVELSSRYMDTTAQKTYLDWRFIIGNHLVVGWSWERISTFWKIWRIRKEMSHRWNIKKRGKR